MHMRRWILGLVALVLCAGASPTPSSASPPGQTFVGPWQEVGGPLGGAVAGLQVDYGPILSWHGGLAALETATNWDTDAQGHSTVTWPGPAAWVSADGEAWTRHVTPGRSALELTLLAWGRRLALVERRARDVRDGLGVGVNAWRFRIWTSSDGTSWARRGGLTLHPRGALRNCGLYDPQAAIAGERIVVVASCHIEHGAGGDRGPGLASLASAVTIGQRVPVYAWSSADARHWVRRLVLRVDEGSVGIESVGGVTLAYRWDQVPRVLWTRDGRRWDAIDPLPLDGDVRYLGVEPIGGADGEPEGWVASGTPDRFDPDPTGGLQPEAPHTTLWRGTPDGTWAEIADGQGWAGVSLAVDGQTIVALAHLVTMRSGPLAPPSPWYRLLVSVDGGATWSDQLRRIDLPRCGAGITLHGSDLVLRCQGEDVAEALLHANLEPGP